VRSSLNTCPTPAPPILANASVQIPQPVVRSLWGCARENPPRHRHRHRHNPPAPAPTATGMRGKGVGCWREEGESVEGLEAGGSGRADVVEPSSLMMSMVVKSCKARESAVRGGAVVK
jgi:hypothetical protein